jgi:hypothetical protein
LWTRKSPKTSSIKVRQAGVSYREPAMMAGRQMLAVTCMRLISGIASESPDQRCAAWLSPTSR